MDSDDDSEDDFKPAAKKPAAAAKPPAQAQPVAAAKPSPKEQPAQPQFSNPPKISPLAPVEERASENIRDTVPITKPPAPTPPKPQQPVEEDEGGERKLTIKELQARMNVAAALSTANPNSDPNNPLARKRMSMDMQRASERASVRESEVKGTNPDGTLNHAAFERKPTLGARKAA